MSERFEVSPGRRKLLAGLSIGLGCVGAALVGVPVAGFLLGLFLSGSRDGGDPWELPVSSRKAKPSRSHSRMLRQCLGLASPARAPPGFATNRMASLSLLQSTVRIWVVRCAGFSGPNCSCAPVMGVCTTRMALWLRGRHLALSPVFRASA